MTPNSRDELLGMAERVEAYDPKLSPDNRADELALHQDVVMLTGEGSLTCDFDRTFVRSLDAAMTLKPDGLGLYTRQSLRGGEKVTAEAHLTRIVSAVFGENASYSGEHDFAEGHAATLPLALTAACLRAHAASVGRNAERHDPEEGRGPKDEHAVPEGQTPTPSRSSTIARKG